MAKVESEIPHNMRKVYRRLQRWRSSHTGRLPIPERLWAAAAELAREHGIYPTAKALHLEYGKLKQRAEAAGPAVKRRGAKVLAAVPRRARRTAPPTFVELMAPRSGRFPGRRGGTGRAAGPDEDRTQGCCHGRVGGTEPGVVGWRGMIQITPQMRILVAVEAVDGRKGIDSLARLCQERLQADPFSGCLFVFRSRRGTAIRILVYDGQGFWLAQKRLSKGRFRWWPEGRNTREVARSLAAHQLQVLLAAGDPTATQAAPAWRPVSVLS